MRALYKTDNESKKLRDIGEFADMISLAKENMKKSSHGDWSQSIVLRTVNNTLHSCVISNVIAKEKTEEMKFIEDIRQSGDVEITNMVCMWPEECFDIGSYDLRKMICDLHECNKNAKFIGSGADYFVQFTLSETIKTN